MPTPPSFIDDYFANFDESLSHDARARASRLHRAISEHVIGAPTSTTATGMRIMQEAHQRSVWEHMNSMRDRQMLSVHDEIFNRPTSTTRWVPSDNTVPPPQRADSNPARVSEYWSTQSLEKLYGHKYFHTTMRPKRTVQDVAKAYAVARAAKPSRFSKFEDRVGVLQGNLHAIKKAKDEAQRKRHDLRKFQSHHFDREAFRRFSSW